MSDESFPESISNRSLRNRKIVLAVMIALVVVIIPLLYVTLITDFDRWTAQWQVWWGLRQAEETAVAQATVISFYQESEDNFIRYRYSAPNNQQYEKTEQVKNSIYQQAEAGEPLIVDFSLDDPSAAGIQGNNDPFNSLIALVMMVLLIMLKVVGRRRRHFPTSSLIKKVAAQDTTQEVPRIPSPDRSSPQWTRIEVILIMLLLLIIQFILIYLLMTK